MKNILPCPYCGGEVEVVKLVKRSTDKDKRFQPYRIECLHCRKLVARGDKFPDESKSDGALRIKQYEEFIAKQLAPLEHKHVMLPADERHKLQQRAKFEAAIKYDGGID